MSFSSLPTLHLLIVRSRIQRTLWCLLSVACFAALTLLFLRGHFSLAVIASVFFSYKLGVLWRDDADALALSWRGSALAVGIPGDERAQRLLYANITLSWAIYCEIAPYGGSKARGLWVFRDSLSARDYRRLRVRMTISQLDQEGY